MTDKQPSRLLLILAGALTQLCGAACLVLALASIPVAHDMHAGMHSLIASIVASLAAIVCGTLAYRGRLVPLALAAGVDLGFGIVLPRGGSAFGTLLRILPAGDAGTADAVVTAGAVTMFVASVLCIVAVPTALALRRWARAEIALESARPSRPSKPMDTLKGFGPARLVPTQVIRIGSPRRTLVVVGVTLTVVALGVIVISAVSGTKAGAPATKGATTGSAGGSGKRAGSAVAVTAAPPAPGDARPADVTADAAQVVTFDDFAARYHAALGRAGAVELGALLDAKAFAFGVDGHEVAEGRDAVVGVLRADLGAGGKVEPRFAQMGSDGDVAWLAEELRVGTHTFVTTAIAGFHDGAWTIAALELATAMPNETAYRLGREGNLPVPDAIPDRHDISPLADAMRAAFASKPSFVEARSTRADAFNFGSAPGERIVGGEAIRKTFTRLRATVRLHDAVAVGAIGARGGWGAANVDFTDADRDGTQVTQTFRVLAAWIHEDAGWRIVQTQWSNAR